MGEKLTGLENLVELRSLALLDDMVKVRGRKGAAEAMGVNRRTSAASVDGGRLTPQLREAVNRVLLLGTLRLPPGRRSGSWGWGDGWRLSDRRSVQ